MAQKPETRFREKVRKHLHELPRCHFFPLQQMSVSGSPDFLVCISGWFVALELKADKKSHVEELQQYELKRVEDAGGFSLVVYPENWEETWNFLTGLATERIRKLTSKA